MLLPPQATKHWSIAKLDSLAHNTNKSDLQKVKRTEKRAQKLMKESHKSVPARFLPVLDYVATPTGVAEQGSRSLATTNTHAHPHPPHTPAQVRAAAALTSLRIWK